MDSKPFGEALNDLRENTAKFFHKKYAVRVLSKYETTYYHCTNRLTLRELRPISQDKISTKTEN